MISINCGPFDHFGALAQVAAKWCKFGHPSPLVTLSSRRYTEVLCTLMTVCVCVPLYRYTASFSLSRAVLELLPGDTRIASGYKVIVLGAWQNESALSNVVNAGHLSD